jgi:hypothetical protein
MDNIIKENFTRAVSTAKENIDGLVEICILANSNTTSEKESEPMNGDKEAIIEGNGSLIG